MNKPMNQGFSDKAESLSGEMWRPYYRAEELSWISSSKITRDYIQWHIRSEWVQKLTKLACLQPSPEYIVLEAGCGTGLYGLSLATMGFQVHAFDYNDKALVFAKKLEAKAREINPDLFIDFFTDNLLDVHAQSNTYDFVFNQAVMEYFVDERERIQAYSEIVRVTKHGGRIAVIVQHTGHSFRKWWEFLGWPGYVDQPPVRIVTPASLARELNDAGLVNVHVDGIYPWKVFFFWPSWFKRVWWVNELIYLLGRFLEKFVPLPVFLRRMLALQIIAVGQKP